MIKSSKQLESLENIVKKIEWEIEEITSEMSNIQLGAFSENRNMTQAECERYFKLRDVGEELDQARDKIINAICQLKDYKC